MIDAAVDLSHFNSVSDFSAAGAAGLLGVEERWLPIKGYEDAYDVSDLGRVRSWRNTRGRRLTEPHLLKTPSNDHGYPSVTLSMNCTGNVRRVHQLVLETFVGPAPVGAEGCHFDGTKTNNVLANLRWDTRLANMSDSKRHGTTSRLGIRWSEHKLSRLTADDIRCICAEPDFRGVVTMLARCFWVSRGHVGNIRRGIRRVPLPE